MYDLVVGGINEDVVGCKEICSQNGVGYLGKDKGKGEVEGGEGEG